MSLLTLPLHKEDYLQRALADFLSETAASPSAHRHTQLEGEYLVRELMDALDLHVAALDALHAAAADMSEDEWTQHETRLEQGLRDLLQQARSLLSREALSLKGSDRLRQRVHDVEYNVFWSVSDYADTPAFQKMVEESQRAYAAEWEEGGWDE